MAVMHNCAMDFVARPSRSTALPWLVLIVGIPASLFLFASFQNAVEDVARLRFEREAQDANSVIEGRLRAYNDVLYAIRALFASNDTVDRLRFHRFVATLDIPKRYPSFISLNYAAHVRHADRSVFEETIRRDTSMEPSGYPQFAIRPAGERDEYFVIIYLEPMRGYEFAMGLDVGANPMADDPGQVAVAVRRQRDTGKLVASGQPLRVKRESEAVYLAMRLPVYRRGMPLDTTAQRHAAYIGSVGTAFDIESLVREAVSDDTFRNLHIRLYDAGVAAAGANTAFPAARRLLFDSRVRVKRDDTRAPHIPRDDEFSHALTVEVGTRNWEFHYSAPRAAVIGSTDRWLAPAVLAGGMLLSLLVFGILWWSSHARSRAVAIASEMTRGLRKREEELRDSTEQLQKVSHRLVDVQESDRREFSRELHDRVGQNLTALSITVDILKSQLPASVDPVVRRRLDDASALLEATTGSIENVMSDLRPPMLDDYGLVPAVQWYAAEFGHRTGVHVRVECEESFVRIEQQKEIALFRIMQEALNNVAKHAHASNVRVVLQRTGQECTMIIIDDGRGLEPTAPMGGRRRSGLGMATMRERTQALGGTIEIGPGPSGGTSVHVRIPC